MKKEKRNEKNDIEVEKRKGGIGCMTGLGKVQFCVGESKHYEK